MNEKLEQSHRREECISLLVCHVYYVFSFFLSPNCLSLTACFLFAWFSLQIVYSHAFVFFSFLVSFRFSFLIFVSSYSTRDDGYRVQAYFRRIFSVYFVVVGGFKLFSQVEVELWLVS